jgi:WD40-like Beta Propeller Repeat
MKTADWIRVLALTGLFASACGSVPSPSVAGSTPSPASTPVFNPCTPPSNRCLALVWLRGSNSYVVRDITDINHAQTVGDLGQISVPAFVSATEVSYAGDNGFVRAPLAGSPITSVATSPGFISYAFAWSPDGSALAYLTQGTSGMVLHQLIAGKDRVFASSMPTMPAVGCESQFCQSTDTWDFRLSYSPDGTSITLVTSIANVSAFRLWSSDGKLLKSSDKQSPYMSAWSGNSLYLRDANGVEVWRDGVTLPFLPGVAWIRPKASSAGGQIVYETRDAQGWAHTFVVDTATKKVGELKKARSEPAFLTSRYVWYKGERSCVAADHCPAGWHVVASGKTYIYDLQDGTETESIITGVLDVWPHAA